MYSFVCPKGVVVQMERGDFMQVCVSFTSDYYPYDFETIEEKTIKEREA